MVDLSGIFSDEVEDFKNKAKVSALFWSKKYLQKTNATQSY